MDLESLRAEIEKLDRSLVTLLADRLDLCLEVAAIKAVEGIPAHLPDRVEMVTARWLENAASRRIDPKFIRHICEQIIAEGTRAQKEAISEAKAKG